MLVLFFKTASMHNEWVYKMSPACRQVKSGRLNEGEKMMSDSSSTERRDGKYRLLKKFCQKNEETVPPGTRRHTRAVQKVSDYIFSRGK
jgi:hypothetical protein